ncbi:efflux RND transporter periplasmic adaptor subunit [Roseateles koreensis]|uniref:Efflux RND transporter periplasmic adaptor subunit n=1 Tax=Roseateles koreensis TaxID=2987526 RepID=A0ABT5KLR5_9BURK|nr:efflux RND transporter periplasmic adaptor subunit [Roseateles koreensis]MDC8783796.1 efflux RND transporter periplasmic adaptor subunit [Roseateles koreensis]
MKSVSSDGNAPRRQAGLKAWIWGGLLIFLMAAGGYWLTQVPAGKGGAVVEMGGPGAKGGGRTQPVTVGEVQRRDLRVVVSAIGTIAAANTAVVRPRVDGELKAIYFAEGQSVRAGQVLALIDPQPFQIALNQAQGVLTRDQAQLRNAQLDLQRYRDLVAKEAAPKQQLDTQDALVQQLQGTVLTDQAALDSAKLQLAYTRVVAPISGLAGLKQADLGNIVHASDTNGLLSIAQTRPVSVIFAIPDARLPQLRAQLGAHTQVNVEAWDRAQKSQLAQGKVASTDNSIDTTTGTIKVKALFANADNSLFPNQFVNVRLLLGNLPQTLAVPSAAVQRGAQGSYVYVVGDGSVVSLRNVSIDGTDGDWVALRGELKPGEKVVTDGADRLRDGAKVEVITPADKGAGGEATPRKGRHRAADGAGAAQPSTLAPASATRSP